LFSFKLQLQADHNCQDNITALCKMAAKPHGGATRDDAQVRRLAGLKQAIMDVITHLDAPPAQPAERRHSKRPTAHEALRHVSLQLGQKKRGGKKAGSQLGLIGTKRPADK
jgi:hypothetical protein